MKPAAWALIPLLLGVGCTTFVSPRYAVSVDNHTALKAAGLHPVRVGDFAGFPGFSANCRTWGPIAPPDQLTFEGYIRKAFVDELTMASLYSDQAPVTLTGRVDHLAFSSLTGVTGGTWDITLTLTSSNGRTLTTREHYEFKSGYVADTACKQTAEAFQGAVQDLIGKVAKSPDFKALTQ
ncbi:hypothetical protein GETHPA_23290 [Geothrix rubra]|uniref:Uncharacterized protein n=1 Tax=Geothrix rubra TaxID=2927977 RepID=A0ABQ5Q8W2_9BACT|nr:hypothetical protein [Geothrix rubra]GLH70796.1 hypothetical protein GETHPA_23290 [Geothrix rubra]